MLLEGRLERCHDIVIQRHPLLVIAQTVAERLDRVNLLYTVSGMPHEEDACRPYTKC